MSETMVDFTDALDNANHAMEDLLAAWNTPASSPLPAQVQRTIENINRSLTT